MKYVKIFFVPEPYLPDDITLMVNKNYVDRADPGMTRLRSNGGGSTLDMKTAKAIRYGFANSKKDLCAGRFYIDREIKSDDDIETFYRTYEIERIKDETEQALEGLE